MPAAEAGHAVVMTAVSKAFGGIRALDGVSFSVARGEVHALLGENGAGKSTILKILSGVQPLDSGTIELNGERITGSSPETARRAGIAMIFQEMSLIPTLTVAQNIFLTREAKSGLGLIDDEQAIRRSRELFHELGVEVDPRARVSELGAGQRQLTEIVKAMSQDARILVLDEPTAALSGAEVEALFGFIRRLKRDGVAIIYVSHRLDEIMRIADRATILRDGKHVITAPMSELTLELIVQHMVGRRTGFTDMAGDAAPAGETLLQLDNVSGRHKPRAVDLIVKRGEVVGVAGLLGSGRSSLARLIAGLEPLASGEVRVRGRPVRLSGPRDAIDNRIALIPEDRIRQGLVTQHSVASNITLPVLHRLSRFSWVFGARARRLAAEQIKRLRIKTASADAPVRTLSGGNQQKVVIAKWLSADPEILVLDEPTAGIDIGSKLEIVDLIRDLARQGKGVVLISSELQELLSASDRIVLMRDGRAERQMSREELFAGTAGADPVERLQRAEHRLSIALQDKRAHA
jgi:ribose transport system ATP-binding protein